MSKNLDDEFFTPAPSGLSTFDAFPKTRATYRIPSTRGGIFTLLLLTLSFLLTASELLSHLSGTESQTFHINPSIGHSLQINLDITVAMPCTSLHINVQDAAMDRILAGELLHRDDTTFDDTSAHRLVEIPGREEHVYHVLSKARKSKWGKTKRRPLSFIMGGGMGERATSCRIYGSMDVNKVQGDFHITAAGHGYYHSGAHIDHSLFNFSHVVNELSFGDYYPSLINPLDGVVSTTTERFQKFQYFLSVVPTKWISHTSGRSVETNQYSVTENSRTVGEFKVPGIFFKFDIEPLSVVVEERRVGMTKFLVRCVNIVGGVMVSGNWIFKIWGMVGEGWRKRRARVGHEGIINEKRI